MCCTGYGKSLETGETTKSLYGSGDTEYGKCPETVEMTKSLEYGKCLEPGETTKSIVVKKRDVNESLGTESPFRCSEFT